MSDEEDTTDSDVFVQPDSDGLIPEELPGGVTLKRKRGGRPVYKYNPQFATIAGAMLLKGATTFEIAEAFGISVRTIWKWRALYPEFDSAFKELGQSYDERIERTLAERAMGYSFKTEKIFNYKGFIIRVPTVEHIAPDISAIKMWLSARQPEKWRIKDEVEVSGDEVFRSVWQKMAASKGEK